MRKKVRMVAEFVLMLMHAVVALALVVWLMIFMVRGELLRYGAFFTARAVKVHSAADIEGFVKKVLPMASVAGLQRSEDGSSVSVYLKDELYGQVVGLKTVLAPDVRKKCEDNPLWYIEGDIECEK